MFISTNYLIRNYGIDDKIARFFVDRTPPWENLYWYQKLLYLRPAPGYLFIPLIIDLLYKTGIERDQLLSEEFVSVMEHVGHISALEETKKITIAEAIEECVLKVKNSRNQVWLQQVVAYLNNSEENIFEKLVTPFKSLHRGDMFLFSLSALQFSIDLFEKIAQQWFALISTLLLIDDADDIETDKETGEENAYLESGLNAEGIARINELVKKSIEEISIVNPIMAAELSRQHTAHTSLPHILHQLNQPV